MHGWSHALEGLSFEQALARTIAALRAEGFDDAVADPDEGPVQASGMRRHRMLVCRAAGGAVAPCRVMVREEAPGHVVVSFLDSRSGDAITEPERARAAEEAGERVLRACRSLPAGGTA